MLKVTDEETRDEAVQDVEHPQRVTARGKGSREETKGRSPASREGPAIEKPRPKTAAEQHTDVAQTRGEPRKSFLRRRPIASALGAILAAAVVGAGAIYFDYTGISNRPTTPSSPRARSRSPRKSRVTSLRFRSPTMSMSRQAA